MRIRYLLFVLMIAIAAPSCTKDEDVKAVPLKKADSVNLLTSTPINSNTLAVSGTLKITIKDSTYTFNAATDSIAVVNIYLDEQKYYGITAINKEHTMSFGISSPGYAAANSTKDIAGGQLLFNAGKNQNIEYTLSQNTAIPQPGKLILTQYAKDSTLAKGTFVTYLSKDAKTTSPFYKVEGSFELKVK